MDTVTTTKEQAAQITGLEVDQIGEIRLQLDALRKQGLLVDLAISGIGMFTRQADWQEIGIPADDVRTERFSRGLKSLIPDNVLKRLRSIESRMRAALDKLSYDVTGFRPYRWLPFTAYEAFRARWGELQAEFGQVKEEILGSYDSYLDALAADFADVAKASWKSIRAADRFPIYDGGAYVTLEDFTDAIVSRAVAKMPSLEKIKAGLRADYTTALVYGQQDIVLDNETAALIRAQLEAKRQAEYLATAALQEQFSHERRMLRMEEQEREMQIEAMLRAEADHARERLGEIASPFEEVFAGLRAQIARDAAEILDSVKKNGFARGNVAERGRGLLEIYDLLAVQNDHELRARLLQLRSVLGPESEKRSTEDVCATLEEIKILAHSAAEDLVKGPSRFGFVQVPGVG